MTKTKKEREREAALESEAAEVELEVEEDRRVARRTFVIATGVAFVLSVFANWAARHLPTSPSASVQWDRLADFVYVLPVFAALWLGHAVLTLHRVGSTTRAHHQRFREESRLFQSVTVATVAFVTMVTAVSYKHQLAVAHWAGMVDWSGHIFPIAIDGVLAVSAASLFILRAASKSDMRAAVARAVAQKASESAAVTAPVQRAAEPPKRESPLVQPAPREPEPRATTQVTQPVAQEPVNHEPRHDSLKLAPSVNREPRREPSSAHRDAAQRLVESRATTQDVDTVAQVLALSDAGLSTREVASAIGGSQSTVRRILAAARDLDTDEERELELVS